MNYDNFKLAAPECTEYTSIKACVVCDNEYQGNIMIFSKSFNEHVCIDCAACKETLIDNFDLETIEELKK